MAALFLCAARPYRQADGLDEVASIPANHAVLRDDDWQVPRLDDGEQLAQAVDHLFLLLGFVEVVARVRDARVQGVERGRSRSCRRLLCVTPPGIGLRLG